MNLDSGFTMTLPMPLYDTCDEMGFGLSVSQERLFRCQPGYGYDGPHAQDRWDASADGMFRVDLRSGATSLLFSVKDFLSVQGIAEDAGEHYFTHVQIAPGGAHFAFIHRCLLASGGMASNFVVCSADCSYVKVLGDDKVSHFDWRDPESLIAWSRHSKAIRSLKNSRWASMARVLYRASRRIRAKSLRQNLYRESFHLFDIRSGRADPIGRGVLDEDGHPQVNPGAKDLWVNDTYPDERGIQTLMLYHQGKNQRVDLLHLPTQPAIREKTWRCDFHPRWHPGGRRVCIDSAHLGRRQVCLLDVDREVESILA